MVNESIIDMDIKSLKIKVCGMTLQQNVDGLEALDVDYIGNIFYAKSSRSIHDVVDSNAIKVGVFVKESIDVIASQVKEHGLSVVQLHGGELNEFCALVKELGVEVWKVFSVDDDFNFKELKNYPNADLFLFDTKSPKHGGTGVKFNWELLNKIDNESPKSYLISGGIGAGDAKEIKNLKLNNLIGLDLNSKFESAPGVKNLDLIKEFLKELKS
jgi:phosphoribosylanthranilate isomerase